MISSTGGRHGLPGRGKVQVYLQVEVSTRPVGQGDGAGAHHAFSRNPEPHRHEWSRRLRGVEDNRVTRCKGTPSRDSAAQPVPTPAAPQGLSGLRGDGGLGLQKQ